MEEIRLQRNRFYRIGRSELFFEPGHASHVGCIAGKAHQQSLAEDEDVPTLQECGRTKAIRVTWEREGVWSRADRDIR